MTCITFVVLGPELFVVRVCLTQPVRKPYTGRISQPIQSNNVPEEADQNLVRLLNYPEEPLL